MSATEDAGRRSGLKAASRKRAKAYRKRNERIEGINDWRHLKFSDPTQIEGFKHARDKRQHLSELTMRPKAIYTLDLTSDIDVDVAS